MKNIKNVLWVNYKKQTNGLTDFERYSIYLENIIEKLSLQATTQDQNVSGLQEYITDLSCSFDEIISGN